MSTYYAIACTQCRQMTDFVKSGGGGWRWMAEELGAIPEFVGKHNLHVEALRVISEHSPEWEAYEDVSKEEPEEDVTR